MSIDYEVDAETLQDCINIASGLFYPIEGFMNSSDYYSVINDMKLSSGPIWTIPITLDVDYETYQNAKKSQKINLFFKEEIFGYIEIQDCFEINSELDLKEIFKTNQIEHPGIKKENSRSKYRVGGPITVINDSYLKSNLDPNITKKFFIEKGWKTIAGFQTRNPIHNAHEYLLRIALEKCDGLFINPLVGWKKAGDFSEEAVTDGYMAMLENYFKDLNVYYDVVKTPMRYAGPREAIFHAIIRRNLGCTHFIIGRDHAGVGNYYGKYEAHELARQISKDNDIGIEFLLMKEPFYCHKCGQIVSEKTCAHPSQFIEKISGTKIRKILSENKHPDKILMRKEIADAIIKLKDNKFIRS